MPAFFMQFPDSCLNYHIYKTTVICLLWRLKPHCKKHSRSLCRHTEKYFVRPLAEQVPSRFSIECTHNAISVLAFKS